MAIPCVVIDKRTGKQYTIPEFAAELNKGMLKSLIDNKILDNTKFERGSRLELFDATAPTSEVMQQTIADVAPNILKSVTKFLEKKGIKPEIILAKTQAEFENLVKKYGGTKEDYSHKGIYATKNMGETKSGIVLVNLTKATSETIYHEITHPFFDILESAEPNKIDELVNGISNIRGGQEFIKAAKILYATEERALPALREGLKKAEEAGETEKATAIKEKIASIEKDVAQQKKEILVDFVARVADGTFEVNRNTFEQVRDYIVELLNSLGIEIGKDYLDQKSIIDLSKKLTDKFESGEDITAADLGLMENGQSIDILNNDIKQINGEGEVGSFNVSVQSSKSKVAAPKIVDDQRSFIKNFVEEKDLKDFNGQKFVTNMYDYTSAGVVDLGNGYTINLLGGKNYVPYMMELKNKKLGEVSNLAAFNSKENAEGFVRNAIEGKTNLFAPHSGTLSESWQFQQHTFSELVNLTLDKKILTNKELVEVFNKTIETSAANKKAFKTFIENYNENEAKVAKTEERTPKFINYKNFDFAKKNPKVIVDFLDVDNNFSPKLRKALNNAIAANKKFQEAIGVKNKEQFYNKIIDPLNVGAEGGEILNVIKFDPSTFEIKKTIPDNIDHHPSFAWTLLAKIEGIYQPTDFYKSSEITDSYTKHNKDGIEISRKSESENYEVENVKSSAGAVPKVAEFNIQFSKSEVGAITKALEDVKAIKDYKDGAELAHRVKNGEPKAIKQMAEEMAAEIPKDAIIVPMTSSSGVATNMLLVANEISKINGNQVADIIIGDKRESLYDLKKKGENISGIDFGLRLKKEVPKGEIYVIDNVVGTGKTASEIKKVLPNSKILVHSIDNKAVNEGLGKGETTIQASRSSVNKLPSDTSIKNASISEDLIARGQPDLVKRAKQTHEESWDKAMDRIDRGFNPKELVQEIITNPRPLSTVEGAMLAYDRLNIKFDYNKKVDQINEAITNGDTELAKKLDIELEDINRQLNENDQASALAGSEWGRSGRFRQEVYSLDMTADTIEKQWRAAKNEDLTTEERAKAEALAKKMDDAQAAYDKHLEEKRQQELAAEIKAQEEAEKKALKQIGQNLGKGLATKEEIGKYRNSLFSKLNDLYNEPKDNIQRSKSEVTKTREEQIKDVIKELAKTYFAEGIRDMDGIVDAVHKDISQFDKAVDNRYVRDAISGYDSTPKPKFNEVKSEMNEIVKQMKMVSEIEDFYKKNPESKRPTIAPKSETTVKLENQLAELKQFQKLFDELESLEQNGLSAKSAKEKKVLSQELQELQQMIADKKKELELEQKISDVEEGNLPAKGETTKRELPPELQKLQDEYNEKKRLLELSNELNQLETEGLSAKTPKEREQVSQEVADLEKKIAEKKKELKYKADIEEINQGKLPTKTEKQIEELSPELQALKNEYEKRKKLLELSKELDSLNQNGLSYKTPAEKKAVDQDIQNLQKQISDKEKELKLKEKIADVEAGNLPEKGQPKTPLSDELQALQDEYNKKKRLLEKQKEFDEFRRYGSKKKPTTRKEVDADIQAIQDQLNEGKRIEKLISRMFDLGQLENHLKALQDKVQELRDKAKETGDENYNEFANEVEQQIKDLIDANQKRGKEGKPKSAKQQKYEKQIRDKEKELGLDSESKVKAANAQLQTRLNQLREMLRTGNVEKPKIEKLTDPRDKKLLAEVEKAKLEVEMEREKLRKSRMSTGEKVRDYFDKTMRAMVLSGGTIIAKLPAAGLARTFISKPLESLLAPGLTPLSRYAPSEGRANRKAQLKAMSEWLEGNNWLIDFAESIKNSKVVLGEEFMNVLKGQGELDMLYGSKKYALDDSRIEFIGRFHAALKNPTKRAEWNRSYIKRLENAIEKGEDVSNEAVQLRIGAEAYADAMRSIFMQDNLISNGYTNFLYSLENNKYAPGPGKAFSSLLQILIPVVKIPTNYVAETGQYIPGLGAYRTLGPLVNVLRHGVESITPEQADYLVRIGKKQGVGAMILAFGYMNSDNIGGYFQDGEKRETKDVKAGEIKVMGMHIPHYVLHSPLFEVMMIGATIKRLEDKQLMKGENITRFEGFKEGLYGSILGLGEQIPQTNPIQGIYRASKNTEGSSKYVGEIASRMIVPQIIKDIAKWIDVETYEDQVVKRSPKTFLDNFKVSIPGLRGDVTMNVKDYVGTNVTEAEYNKLVETGAIDKLTPYTNRKFQTLDTPPKTYYMSLEELNKFNNLRNQLLAKAMKEFINDKKVSARFTDEDYKNAVGYIQRGIDHQVLQMMNLDDLNKVTQMEAEKRTLENIINQD